MRILVVGSGGREHALCWAISGSPLCDKLYCAPGNPGIAAVAERVPIADSEHQKLVDFCRDTRIDFVVVGPEAPLVAGLADRLREAGIKTFGPSASAARLEGSKAFTKEITDAGRIPTAGYCHTSKPDEAIAFIEKMGAPIVVKADGLAAGKGVVVAQTIAEAIGAVHDMLSGNRFGSAGSSVVIEEFLDGEEVSFFVLADGKNVLPLIAAQDHKRVGDGDTGPNTGGMGAYSPTPRFTPDMQEDVMRRIIVPTIETMKARGTPYQGVLYAGLMLTAQGPKLIEYNCRFGDPECQVLMLRLKSDLLPALIATADGALANFDLRWHDQPALTVVMAAEGYPEAPKKGSQIRGLDKASEVDGVEIFHAGTRSDGERLLADGGRVLNICAMAFDLAQAREQAYRAIGLIDWPQGFCRRDIAWRALPSNR